ncbi:MAG: type III pantothenate kinase [Gammaproteobacteria bacterium]|nr:type III pantothenate kinase [Gammaproteobacteria bacterium]
MILLFDLGNSRAKWATWAEAGYAHAGSTANGGSDFADSIMRQLRPLAAPDRAVAANVAGPRAISAVREAAQSLWRLPVEELRPQGYQCGVRSAYSEPAQIGVDRWLAMLAAWNRFRRAVCVLDLGTAATADVVAADGRHLGGLIAPGFSMSQSLLLEQTAAIGAAGSNPGPVFGRSTGDCVANGCLLSVIGLARSALELMERECGAGGVLVATGGEAPRILPYLPVPHNHVPTLVFDGMLLAGGLR